MVLAILVTLPRTRRFLSFFQQWKEENEMISAISSTVFVQKYISRLWSIRNDFRSHRPVAPELILSDNHEYMTLELFQQLLFQATELSRVTNLVYRELALSKISNGRKLRYRFLSLLILLSASTQCIFKFRA